MAIIDIVDLNVFYRAYHNNISVTINGIGDGELILSGVNVEITDKGNGQFTIIPGRGRIAKLVVAIKSNGQEQILKTSEFRVANLPYPEIYLGGKRSGYRISSEEYNLIAKYPPEIPINASFKIKRWELISMGDSISGTNEDLEKISFYLKESIGFRSVQIKGVSVGPDGIGRRFAGVWDIENP